MPHDFDENIDRRVDEYRGQEEEALASVLASARYKIPYVDLSATTIQNEALRLVTEEEARRIGVAPFKIFGKEVSVAVLFPASEEVRVFMDDLTRKGYVPSPFMTSHASLERAWARYKELSF